MPKKIDYCSLVPEFPEKAYMAFLFILHKDHILGTIPLDAIYTNLDQTSEAISQVIEQLQGNNNAVTIPQECLLLPLEKHSLFPLKKDYWKKPEIIYDEQTRIATFESILDNPSFFSLLVTPYSYDDLGKRWFLNAALPLKNIHDIKSIEKFMLTSDYVVEPRAASAAIYTIGEKTRFNWYTKETKPFEKHKSSHVGKTKN